MKHLKLTFSCFLTVLLCVSCDNEENIVEQPAKEATGNGIEVVILPGGWY